MPRHEPGPPETLTDADYVNLLRVPDRRSREGKRDYAVLRVLGDCGLRSAELRRLRARGSTPPARERAYLPALRARQGRPRSRGLGARRRQARGRCLGQGPPARQGVGLLDEQPLFVRLGRHGDEHPRPLSAEAVLPARAPPLPGRGGAGAAGAPARAAGPTGPPTCSRPACRSTRSPRGSGTSTCGPPRAARRPASGARGRDCRGPRSPPPGRAAGWLGGVELDAGAVHTS